MEEPSHGYLDLTWSGDVLYVKAVGPFNDAGAKTAAEAYVKEIQDKTCESFAVIEILSPDSIGPPETMKAVEQTWRFLGEQGCHALALVCSNAVQQQLAEARLPAFGRLFRSVSDAEEWVRERA